MYDVSDELFVATHGNAVFVYGREDSGEATPLRELRGEATLLDGIGSVAIDTIADELVVGSTLEATGLLLAFADGFETGGLNRWDEVEQIPIAP